MEELFNLIFESLIGLIVILVFIKVLPDFLNGTHFLKKDGGHKNSPKGPQNDDDFNALIRRRERWLLLNQLDKKEDESKKKNTPEG